MNLYEMFNGLTKKKLTEGGNLSVGGHEAQQIDLKVHNRAYIVPVLNKLLQGISDAYQQQYQVPLWDPKLIQQRTFLSGSSLHFFNTDIPDDEFVKVKPKVGDIDTQVNKEYEANLNQFLTASKGKVIGNATLLGHQKGNEQYSSLWELTDPPIKVQIDLEFVAFDKKGPTAWSQFSHSSSWDDLQAGVKGVFHKFLIQAFTTLTSQDFLLQKSVGRGANKSFEHIPTRDNMFSFAVSSKEGGGLRAKYAPVMDERGKPLFIDGQPVMQPLPAQGYEQDLTNIFATIFGDRAKKPQLKKLLPDTWSFTGLLKVMNLILTPEEKQEIVTGFIEKIFGKGAQGLYRNDPNRDITEKNTALNLMLQTLQIQPPADLEQKRQSYKAGYKMANEGPIGLDKPVNEAEVKAQFRKNMPHLRDLKPIDFLDLLDEIHDGNGNFKLQNIPLNVKVDGFGGRFGKDAEGKPFMATSNTPPRYKAGFVQYHQEKGTTDPEILGRAEKFDQLFNEMMNAIKLVDSKLGSDFLVNKQVTCEVLFLPFATETAEGKLKFVGIQYDKFAPGVQLVLVPFRVVDASTGEDIPDADQVVASLTKLGGQGSVKFISNALVQKEGLDVTEIINPLDNIEALKQIVSDTHGKRDRASLQLRKEVEEKLMPVKIALEKAIDSDPNIVGKDILGQDYEGIVINSRLGPIKITSQKQKDIITQKNAAKAAARVQQPATQNKTAVVAIGSFVGHKGHQELFKYTIDKAKEVGGDPYLFMGNAVGVDDPVPVEDKIKTWKQLYPSYANNISATMQGGSLMQKIKHELINPLPGKPPRYDNVIIMVGEDQANMPIANALMKAVNKFPGYEHVKVSLEVTPRGTGMSFTKLRNILKTGDEQTALDMWSDAFNGGNSGAKQLPPQWIKHLMDVSRTGMGIQKQPAAPQPAKQPTLAETRLFNALTMPLNETKRMSAAVKLQRAWQQQQEKSAASRKRGEEVMAQAKKDAEKKQQNVAEAEKNPHTSALGKALYRDLSKEKKASPAQVQRNKERWAKRQAEREQGIEEGHDEFGFHSAVGKGKFLPSKFGNKRFVYLHDLEKQSPSTGGPQLVTIDDAAAAKEIANQYGGKVVKTKLDTYRIVQPATQGVTEYGDTAKGQKMLTKVQKRAVDRVVSKKADTDPAYAKKNKATADRAWDRMSNKDVAESNSPAMAQTAKRLTDPKDGAVAKLRAAGDKRREEHLKGRDIAKKNEAMMPASKFAGSDKNKLGSAGQLKGTAPKEQPTHKLVGETDKKKGADGKACWKGYKYAGTKNGKDKCVPIGEGWDLEMAKAILKLTEGKI